MTDTPEKPDNGKPLGKSISTAADVSVEAQTPSDVRIIGFGCDVTGYDPNYGVSKEPLSEQID